MMYINHTPLNDLIASGTHQQSIMGLATTQNKLFQPQAHINFMHNKSNQLYTLPQSFLYNNNNNTNQPRSSSTSSSISTTSSSSTSPTSSIQSTNPINISQLYTKNLSITNNLYPAFTGFAYYNPTFTYPTSSSSQATLSAAQNVNSSSSTNSNMSNLNILNENSNTPQSTSYSSCSIADSSRAANDLNKLINLSNTNSLYLLKNQQAKSNIYDSSLSYSTNSDCGAFYITSDQTNPLSTLQGSYLSPGFTDLGFGTSLSTKDLLTYAGKTPYAVTGLNGLNCFKKHKKRFKKPIEYRKVLPKNSLMLLHELRPNVEYRFVCQSGPIHRPVFTMCVDINEHKFEGLGKTKKLARMQAAEKAIEFLMENPDLIQKQKKPIEGEAIDCSLNDEHDENSRSSQSENTSDVEENAKRFKKDDENEKRE